MDINMTQRARDTFSPHKPKAKTISPPEERFFPSDYVTIQCGCIPIDPNTRKIAILKPNDHAHQPTSLLPISDKNINEDLLPAALRIAHERTGMPFFALPLKVPTRAVPTLNMDFEEGEDDMAITETLLNCEASSVCIRDLKITGRVEVEFWFAVRGDSTVGKTEVKDSECGRGWKVEWVDAKSAGSRLSYNHKLVVEKVLVDMRKSGFNI